MQVADIQLKLDFKKRDGIYLIASKEEFVQKPVFRDRGPSGTEDLVPPDLSFSVSHHCLFPSVSLVLPLF